MTENETIEMDRHEVLPLGIVIERRAIESRWADYEWRPVAVIPGAPPQDPRAEWRQIMEGDGWVHYHAATLDLELFRGETEGYKVNLANFQPHVYVVLLPGSEADDPEIIPHLATACPYEAEGYTEDSDQIVEGVPMPPDVAAWVQAFIDKFHVDVPFKKRKRNKAYDPRKGDFRRGPAGGKER